MKKILAIITAAAASVAVWLALSSSGEPQTVPATLFEKAVTLIKKYETLHRPRHWPLVGYGHLVTAGERFSRSRTLSEAEADALLRRDLLKNCAAFRDYGADSLLLGVLAYNIGAGNVRKSSVARKLREGDRDISASYLAHCRYRGRRHPGLARRRAEELELLFVADSLAGAYAAAVEIMSDSAVVAADDITDYKLSNPENDE